MELLGSIARTEVGGAYGRRPGAVPAVKRAASHDGEGGGHHGGTIAARQRDDAAAQAKAAEAATAALRDAEAPPAPVQIEAAYDRRVGNGRTGYYVDLIYKNTGQRAVRLFGRSEAAAPDPSSEQAAVAAGTAARAYQAALGDPLSATTELTS